MTAKLWDTLLRRFASEGTANEKVMARMLLDLITLPEAQPIVDGWTLNIMNQGDT